MGGKREEKVWDNSQLGDRDTVMLFTKIKNTGEGVSFNRGLGWGGDEFSFGYVEFEVRIGHPS